MRIAITGATGFLGRYIVRQLAAHSHHMRLWCRRGSDRSGFDDVDTAIEWTEGDLGDPAAAYRLAKDCDAVVHAALDRPGAGFRGAEGDVLPFVQRNLIGTLQLIEESRAANVRRFIFVSSCAVHERILDDRPLDETHPLWPLTHYGAHKAAIEKFIHSYGMGLGYPICAIRPTGIYGVAHRVRESKWFDLIQRVVRGEAVECVGGGKEVHAADVAKAVELLLFAESIAGEAFACYDRYVSQFEVATIAQELCGSTAEIRGQASSPKHQIVTEKIRALGMQFGGDKLLRETIARLVAVAQAD
jgi:nucleoside-diphosphate-sugar epimerase